MTLSVPPFPTNDELPSPQKMSNLLVCALPEPDRSAANKLLMQHILPVKLAGIDYHPRPQRLSVRVYIEISRELSARPANMRLHALKLVATGTELQRLSRDSLNLAITRFLLDNTGELDAEKLERWLTPAVQDLRELSESEITEQASALGKALESWKQSVASDYPAEWPKYRVTYRHTKATLDNITENNFDAACGSLLEFLRDAGRSPKEA